MLARFANRIAAIEELSELILAPEAPSACSTAIWEKGAIASNRPMTGFNWPCTPTT